MAPVRTLNASDAGTRRSPSIDKGIWGCEGTSALAAGNPSLGAGGELLLFLFSGGGFPDGSEAVPLERHFWVRNALYGSNYLTNPLKLQNNGAPSERTTSHLALKPVPLETCDSVLVGRHRQLGDVLHAIRGLAWA